MRDSGLKATSLVMALGLGGCAGGGGLELEGPAAQQVFQQYSGTWELDADRSDDPGQLLADATRAQSGRGSSGAAGAGAGRGGGGRGGGGGFPGGGGRAGGGGRSGGGGGGDFPGAGGGRGGPGGGRPSPEAMQMGMALARDVATTLELRLDSVFVRLTSSAGGRASPPCGGVNIDPENRRKQPLFSYKSRPYGIFTEKPLLNYSGQRRLSASILRGHICDNQIGRG